MAITNTEQMPLVAHTVVAHAGLDLPLSPDIALPIMGVGVLVLAAVAYDAYQVYDDRVAPEVDTNDG